LSERLKGTRRRLSPARHFIGEMMRHARKVPLVRITRRMGLAEVVAAREGAGGADDAPTYRPAWPAIFMKAFALVARDQAYLRQVYIPLPWAHLYEYPHSIGVLMIEREHRGERIVLGTKIRAPESQSLAEITAEIRRHQTEPVETLGRYRMALMSGSLPWPLRRLQWWSTLYVSGFKRVKRFGTFGVSSVGHLGAESHPIAPSTTIVTYGPIADDGHVNVSLIVDHRVYDGANAARCLAEMEEALNGEIIRELNMKKTNDETRMTKETE
jgi:hypothetical protein